MRDPLTDRLSVKNVGIDAAEFYFPKCFVNQEDLEKFNEVSSGKYTKGLGQHEMGFCADNEDIVSISMTVTKKLLDTYKILADSIGCLVVGTETLIDKSKSVKTALMDLFDGNTDIEGVDIKNACFGGAQALLHAVDWVSNNHAYQNRNAIVVVADIAVYASGPARCTGGAGAMAFLIAPNSAIPIDRIYASFHMKNSWDFYKPIKNNVSEYPIVDGSLSLSSYLGAVKASFANFKKKALMINGSVVSLKMFDAIFLHSPFTKMVQKGLAVMNYGDLESDSLKLDHNSRDDMVKMIDLSSELWKQKTDPYLTFNRRIGNMYTPSMFAQLLAYLASDNCVSGDNDEKNVLFFAYGSGLSSGIFPARVRKTETLNKIRETSIACLNRLDDRKRYKPEEFTEILNMRERFLSSAVPVVPESVSKINTKIPLFSNTFFLNKMDECFRRDYSLHISSSNGSIKNGN